MRSYIPRATAAGLTAGLMVVSTPFLSTPPAAAAAASGPEAPEALVSQVAILQQVRRLKLSRAQMRGIWQTLSQYHHAEQAFAGKERQAAAPVLLQLRRVASALAAGRDADAADQQKVSAALAPLNAQRLKLDRLRQETISTIRRLLKTNQIQLVMQMTGADGGEAGQANAPLSIITNGPEERFKQLEGVPDPYGLEFKTDQPGAVRRRVIIQALPPVPADPNATAPVLGDIPLVGRLFRKPIPPVPDLPSTPALPNVRGPLALPASPALPPPAGPAPAPAAPGALLPPQTLPRPTDPPRPLSPQAGIPPQALLPPPAAEAAPAANGVTVFGDVVLANRLRGNGVQVSADRLTAVTAPPARAGDVLMVDTAPITEPLPVPVPDEALQLTAPKAIPTIAPAGVKDTRSLEERVTRIEQQIDELSKALKRDPEFANARAEKAQAEAQERVVEARQRAAEIDKLQLMTRQAQIDADEHLLRGKQLRVVIGRNPGDEYIGSADDSRAIEQIFFPPAVMKYLGIQLANQ